MAKRRWARALRRRAARGDAVGARELLRNVHKWREVELQRALNAAAPSTEVIRVFAEECPDFWEDGGGARATMIAATSGREALLLALLEAGVDPQAGRGSFEGGTPLHAAAEAGHEGCVRTLLDAGADVHSRSSFQWTPLHWAAHGGRAGCVRLLLAAGADIHALDTLNRTPLHWAASCGYLAALLALLEAGAQVQLADYIGLTPLHLAANGVWEVDWSSQLPDKSDWDAPTNHLGCIRSLVQSGSHLDAKDQEGKTALLVAAMVGYTAGGELLLELGADFQVIASDGQTALHMACRSGSRECVRLFLKRGVQVQDNAGRTPLHVAAMHANASECVEELSIAGASTETLDAMGLTPLHCAAMGGRPEAVDALLRLGAALDATDNSGRTPLHHAAPHWPTLVRLFLSRGATVDMRDILGYTPLHVAAEEMYVTQDSIRALLEAGANRNARDIMGRTPAEVAANPNVRRLIENWAIAA